MRSSVLLPEPLGPMMPTISPWLMRRSMSCSAQNGCFVATCRATRCGRMKRSLHAERLLRVEQVALGDALQLHRVRGHAVRAHRPCSSPSHEVPKPRPRAKQPQTTPPARCPSPGNSPSMNRVAPGVDERRQRVEHQQLPVAVRYLFQRIEDGRQVEQQHEPPHSMPGVTSRTYTLSVATQDPQPAQQRRAAARSAPARRPATSSRDGCP